MFLYNDAYAAILGDKHPAAAGARFADVWHEIWPEVQPIVALALAGTSSYRENAKFTVRRHGRDEEAWFEFSYSPLLGDDNQVRGMFCACSEKTGEVLAARALKAADARKDEFLAMLAHELRNPLAPIATAAELLNFATPSAHLLQKTSTIISRQVRHMTQLLDDPLDVSRVTRGMVSLRSEMQDIAVILQESIEQVQANIDKRGQRLHARIEDWACFVHGDRTRLVQIFSNLLNNASTYTQQGGDINLAVRATDTLVTFAISDNGAGIPATLLPHVFDLFTQGERAPDRAQGGLGLGLSLVKSLVELQRGQVSAHSDGPGKGSTFSVQLPRAQSKKAALAMPVDAADGMAPNAGIGVLVVDDNIDAADTLGALLSTMGYSVQVAHSSSEALSKAHHFRPAIAFLDIGLPDMDGYTLARKVRKLPATSEAVLVALTGYAQPEDVERALAAGFNHHIAKPAKLSMIFKVLGEAAARGQPMLP